MLPNLQFLYSVLQGAGTDLSPDMFRTVIFGAAIVEGTVIAPQISWGERGIWPGIDYGGVDDQTEVWWDPDATGLDETGKEGTGLWTTSTAASGTCRGSGPSEPPSRVRPRRAPSPSTPTCPPGITLPELRAAAPA